MAVVSEYSGSRGESRESSPVLAKSSNFLRFDEDLSFLKLSTRSRISSSPIKSAKDSAGAILENFRSSSEAFTVCQNVNPDTLLLSLLKTFPVSDEPNLKCMLKWDRSSVRPEIISLMPKCWHYRGEGNANLVVALDKEATIIRFSKNLNGAKWSDHQKKKIERQVVFARNVFAPLLGRQLVANVRIVFVSPDQIVLLNQCLRTTRPADRLHKEIVMPYATAHNDFARISSFLASAADYCIEIKPKKGWWSKDNALTGKRPDLCTYCLNQFLKMKKSKILSRSAYCPLDLFSGQAARMVKAVTALLMNPQNNLRIFKNGSLVYSDTSLANYSEILFGLLEDWLSRCGLKAAELSELGLFNSLVFLICIALIKPQMDLSALNLQRYRNLVSELEKVFQDQNSDESYQGAKVVKEQHSTELRKKSSCSSDSSPLPTGCVLSRILQAQKLEDACDEQIKKVFQKLCQHHKKVTNSGPCPDIVCTTVEAWLDELDTSDLTVDEIHCIQRHLLAATVKDCSIMLTFAPFPVENRGRPDDIFLTNVVQDLLGGHHCFQVGIVDLDPKPLTSVVKHNLRDTEMIRAYLERM